jgi:hypothetical protein
MIHKQTFFSEFSRHIVWHNVYFDFELLCDGILNIVINLSESVQELVDIGGLLHLVHGLLTRVLVLRRLGAWYWLSIISGCDIFHSHKDFIDSCNVFLYFGDIMLEYSALHSLARPQSFHNGRVFVPDIFFNDALKVLDLIKSMVKSHDLTDQLSSFGD